MAVFRVNKSDNYTVMSNYHFKDKRLSLKAKGLLSEMLSLPDTWDYSLNGLIAINKENETAIKSALNELKDAGYVIITRLNPNQTESKQFEWIYDIFEQPNQYIGFQPIESQPIEVLSVENHTQLNTKEVNTKESNTNKGVRTSKANKTAYGVLENVYLTDDELAKLKQLFKTDWENRIDTLSEYIASKGDKYKSHYATILNWYRRENGGKSANAEREYF